MKKIIFATVLAVAGMATSQAQVQFGAKAGFDLTHFWGEDAPHGLRPNYQVGLMMEYKFAGSNLAIAPEVVFASQGGSEDLLADVSGAHYDLNYTTNYINVPVMLKYYASSNFSVDFGPQIGFNVYSKAGNDDFDVDRDLKDHTKTVDFGLGLGATYNLSSNAFLQARYTLGLTKVFDIDHSKAKNGNAQISFGYKF